MQEDLAPAFRQFADALVAFAEEPGPANLERYLDASRSLEESRRSGQAPTPARARTEGARAAVRRATRTVAVSTARGDV